MMRYTLDNRPDAVPFHLPRFTGLCSPIEFFRLRIMIVTKPYRLSTTHDREIPLSVFLKGTTSELKILY